jgi:hypothetical protein
MFRDIAAGRIFPNNNTRSIILIYLQDLINLAPRKPDWDLKRDISKKLERLERRTQRAIAEIISKFSDFLTQSRYVFLFSVKVKFSLICRNICFPKRKIIMPLFEFLKPSLAEDLFSSFFGWDFGLQNVNRSTEHCAV